MFLSKMRSQSIKSLCLSFLFLFLSLGLISCSDRLETSQSLVEPLPEPVVTNQLAEVAPPRVIQELRQTLDQYQPQVKIISPESDRVFSEPNIAVKLDVKDYPLFKDSDLGLGPHLHLILDNEPYQAVYSVDEPIILDDLTPGTHTLRVFASRPWHESFKNDGAYSQTTFHILTKTEDNNPDPSLPLLTYSRPKGTYGAQPIMLDFYLTNAPLHLIAQEDPNDDVADWRIRATINGESFLVDTWQPIYLKGFEEGTNWVKLEFLDQQGNLVNNVFNNTVRLITYQPNGQDTLSKLVRGELSAEVARSIVDPNYKATASPITPAEKAQSEEIESSVEEPSSPIEETPTEEVEPSNEEIESSVEEPSSPIEETPTEEVEPSNEQIEFSVEEPLSPIEETPTEEVEPLTEDIPSTPEEKLTTSGDAMTIPESLPSSKEEVKEDEVTSVPEESLEASEPSPEKSKPSGKTAAIPQEKVIKSQDTPSDSTISLDEQPQWRKSLSNALGQISERISQSLEDLKDRVNP